MNWSLIRKGRRITWSCLDQFYPTANTASNSNPKLLLGISLKYFKMTNFEPMAMFHQSQCLVNICCASKKTKNTKWSQQCYVHIITKQRFSEVCSKILTKSKEFWRTVQHFPKNLFPWFFFLYEIEVPRYAVAGFELWPIGHSKGQVNSGATWQPWRLTRVMFW